MTQQSSGDGDWGGGGASPHDFRAVGAIAPFPHEVGAYGYYTVLAIEGRITGVSVPRVMQ